MKNLTKLILLLFVFSFSVASFAQQKPKKTTEVKVAAKEQKKVVKEDAKLKKDGTPDKRYKANQPKLKKDGTLDKRYKGNK